MLRESALNTKRSDLEKCLGSRKRKLSELYSVVATVNATVTPSASLHEPNTLSKFTKVEFQDANDITLGRVFDVATLLRIPGFAPKQIKQPLVHPLDSAHSQSQHQHAPTTKDLPPDSVRTRDGVSSSEGASPSTPATQAESVQQPADDGAMDGVVVSLGQDGASKEESLGGSMDSMSHSGSGGPSVTTHPASQYEDHRNISFKDDRDLSSTAGRKSRPEQNPAGDDSTGRLVAEDTKVQIVPLTPDAQLRQEAALSAGHQNIAATESPVTEPANKLSNGDGPQPSTAELTAAAQTQPAEEHTIVARRQGAQQDPGMNTDASRDVLLSQRPPMRIDTAVSRPQRTIDASTPATAFTPLKSGMQSSSPDSRRMTTRVSSGALRHKSVSEILGETPKTPAHAGDKTLHETYPGEVGHFVSRRSSMVASPESASRSRFGDGKDRTKLSTVVFAPRRASGDKTRQGEAADPASRRIKTEEEKDYLVPLFAAQAHDAKPALEDLIRNSNKVLSTSNWYIQYQEMQNCRILKRIYHLQNSNRWSLRQIERSAEPPRPTSHWDMLLNEVKWMRTDFREERKWKLAAARNMAMACAEWVEAPESLRPSLQVRIKKPQSARNLVDGHTTPISTPKDMDTRSDGTPELVPSAEDDMSDSAEELPVMDLSKTNAPAALFSLAPEDVLFELDRTPAADKLLSELPLYQPFVDPKGSTQPYSETLDAAWRKPVIPVSKFTLAKLVTNDEGPPMKRSRFVYAEEDETEVDSNGRALLTLDRKHSLLPPEQDNVAMFDPKNGHIITRLHAAHSFRPPSEFPMPTKPFFESRNPSQWTVAEDDELRKLVREYEYNWSLISACLSSQSMFSSGAERRTPWECFERWENLEGLPGDMEKHSYFKAWKSRRVDAKHHLEQLYAAQQQAGATAQLRRRNAEPVHVERRRNNKHLALIHAMSKVAKKKETALQKQQHAASMAAMRKASEPSQKKLIIRTPKEFSDHKHEQEMAFKQKQMEYRQQIQANQRAIQAQRAMPQAGQQQNGLAVGQPGRMPVPGQMNGTSPRVASSLPQGATQPGGRPVPPSQAMLNGLVPSISNQNGQVRAIPQAQMQAYMANHARMAPQNSSDPARVMMEATRVQEQQRMMQQQRQFQAQGNGVNGVASSQNSTAIPMQGGSAAVGNIQPNGKSNSPNHAQGHQRNSSSPSMLAVNPGKQLSNGFAPLLNQITSQIRTQYPNLTPEQVTIAATNHLNQQLNSRNSANGNGGQMPQQQQNMNYNPSMNPQLYAQIMRSQQAHQQSRNGTDANGTRPESRGATPKGGVPQNGSSQSPHPAHAQVASTS